MGIKSKYDAIFYVAYRFLHKNPEDANEVPNGFVSDINPVSYSSV